MRVPMAILADAANVSREGKLNVLGIFDTIRATNFPATQLSMVFAFRLQANYKDSAKTYPIKVTLEDIDAQKLFTAQGEVEVPKIGPGEFQSTNRVFSLVGIEFPKPGEYKFVVHVADERHETRFTVIEVS